MPGATEVICRQATLEEIHRLRFAVLRPGQPVVKVYFPNDSAAPPAAWHFGAFIPEAPGESNGQSKGGSEGQTSPGAAPQRNVACLTWLASTWENAPAMQLRGMAVAEEFRRHGIGGRLLDFSEKILADSGCTRFWCNARQTAVPFYQRHGWRCASAEFLISGVGPHFKMIKNPRSDSV